MLLVPLGGGFGAGGFGWGGMGGNGGPPNWNWNPTWWHPGKKKRKRKLQQLKDEDTDEDEESSGPATSRLALNKQIMELTLSCKLHIFPIVQILCYSFLLDLYKWLSLFHIRQHVYI